MYVDKDELIEKVHLRSVIWDKRVKGHTSRILVDRAWQDIAVAMGIQEGILRKKWKYLRDQFSVEIGKSRRSKDSGHVSESKWPYLKSLMFLKEIVKPRASSNLKKAGGIPEEEKDEPFLPEDDDSESIEHGVGKQKKNQAETSLAEDLSSTSIHCNRECGGIYCEQIIPREDKKTTHLESVTNREPLNEDELFLNSLLPHIKKIPPEWKLRFRSKIQQVVEEFAYPRIHFENIPTAYNSSSGPSPEEIEYTESKYYHHNDQKQ